MKIEINWKQARKYLSVATDIIGKLPYQGDGPFVIFVKLLAIADSFEKKLGKDNVLFDFFSNLNADTQNNNQFVDLFFSTPLLKSFSIQKIAISDYTDIIIASDRELGTLYFIEYHWGSKPEPSSEFWYSKGFNFEGALERMWTLFRNGIYIGLKDDKDRVRTQYQPILFTKDPIIGEALLRLNALIEKHKRYQSNGFHRTYLFVGKQGVGKSTFATRLAQACGSRVLQIDARGLTVAGATDLSFLIHGLQPDFLILDDIDRIADMKLTVPILLKALSDLKERHPTVTVVMTANDVTVFDPAIIRPGRIDRVIEFEDPSPDERRHILAGYLEEFGASCASIDGFVEATDGLTAAYLQDIAIQIKNEDDTSEIIENIRLMRSLAEKAKGTATPAATTTPETKKAS